ncbi:hypothetical protein B0T18DRAFT_108609 [Schizothecium vesticola]|uniref:Uncharacterized protein n=1 Tax=Schizothecium vesticola TaxID=314040 RepID=A0AA40F1K9_9PEZI|nr:hypothetical protein B0T18DRAFT_108609 [Schizothecium vesticola]
MRYWLLAATFWPWGGLEYPAVHGPSVPARAAEKDWRIGLFSICSWSTVSFPSNMPAFGLHLCDPSHPTAVWTARTRTRSMGDDGRCSSCRLLGTDTRFGNCDDHKRQPWCLDRLSASGLGPVPSVSRLSGVRCSSESIYPAVAYKTAAQAPRVTFAALYGPVVDPPFILLVITFCSALFLARGCKIEPQSTSRLFVARARECPSAISGRPLSRVGDHITKSAAYGRDWVERGYHRTISSR